MTSNGAEIFQADLLTGAQIALSSGSGDFREQIAASCAELGASVHELADQDATVDALVVDASGFSGGMDGVSVALEKAWVPIRELTNSAFIPASSGKVIVIAPRPDVGPGAHALRVALENLARTLSIEWSRYNIRTAAILPGAATTPDQAATLVAYLISPAGDYFSGCKFELGLVGERL